MKHISFNDKEVTLGAQVVLTVKQRAEYSEGGRDRTRKAFGLRRGTVVGYHAHWDGHTYIEVKPNNPHKNLHRNYQRLAAELVVIG